VSEREQAQEHAARLEWIAERTAGVDARRELRYAATFLHALADRKAKKGVAALCLGGGNAVAMAVRAL